MVVDLRTQCHCRLRLYCMTLSIQVHAFTNMQVSETLSCNCAYLHDEVITCQEAHHPQEPR